MMSGARVRLTPELLQDRIDELVAGAAEISRRMGWCGG